MVLLRLAIIAYQTHKAKREAKREAEHQEEYTAGYHRGALEQASPNNDSDTFNASPFSTYYSAIYGAYLERPGCSFRTGPFYRTPLEEALDKELDPANPCQPPHANEDLFDESVTSMPPPYSACTSPRNIEPQATYDDNAAHERAHTPTPTSTPAPTPAPASRNASACAGCCNPENRAAKQTYRAAEHEAKMQRKEARACAGCCSPEARAAKQQYRAAKHDAKMQRKEAKFEAKMGCREAKAERKSGKRGCCGARRRADGWC